MSDCPKCGAPAGPSAPDGDFRYRPPTNELARLTELCSAYRGQVEAGAARIAEMEGERDTATLALSALRATAGRAINGLREWYGQDVFRTQVMDVPEIAALIAALSQDQTGQTGRSQRGAP